ncbi:hypothetical protein SAMN05660690_0343 [Geodermatophilus telluris]|uniref:Uncharacterized protein n=1 Tax=Geodermatophilus telluris TaxID=1190417 RepID=A0A1G6IF12_9ACTN|nr:hypothetical protein [Geodermatophilus telluris]SDC04973.1 hypothetical protein SAMN05660690_0343 [Geodermatophilus telluris]
MRWQQLFADLQAEFEAAEEWAQLPSRSRAETGTVRLADRLGGAVGHRVSLRCRGAGEVAGRLTERGPDWLLLEDDAGREVLVALPAVLAVSGLVRTTAAPEDGSRVTVDLRRVLRGLVRDRSAVAVVLDDGGVLTGTLDRVGADFVELAEHAPDDFRRAGAVRGVRAVALGAVVAVRTLAPGAA